MNEPLPAHPTFSPVQVLTAKSLERLEDFLRQERRLRTLAVTTAISIALMLALRWVMSRTSKTVDRVLVGGEPWQRVDTLAGSSPQDRHFVLDPATGSIVFGDGARGARVPPGEHVEASYRICPP